MEEIAELLKSTREESGIEIEEVSKDLEINIVLKSLYAHHWLFARTIVIEHHLCLSSFIQFHAWIPVERTSVIHFAGDYFAVVLRMVVIDDFGIAVDVSGTETLNWLRFAEYPRTDMRSWSFFIHFTVLASYPTCFSV